ncbi:MAG TPA: DUF488 domain-containing protein [Steroidobacteraceae bacterium]|nr:DUF488 domain-containing protein [Steroidobacteraceae bacterium]
MTIWTIGHSTRSIEEFVNQLETYDLQAVADVRRLPGSRRLPHFDQDSLAERLDEHDIEYRWFAALGGRRRGRADSLNTAWRNPSFRAYADYLDSQEFASGLADLLELAKQKRTTLMCAEAVWWRCHRALIADVLKARGIPVMHILDASHATEHPYSSAARIVDGRLTYEGAQE